MYGRLIGAVVGLLISGCSDNAPNTDEAYRVGYDIGIADECGSDGVRIEPMPSAYDDSMGEGELATAFQAGYRDARGKDRPCR
jgi:hypothetical protein